MFIKLTRKDGSNIWLNAGLIVTVEAVRGGGAIVVPVGDGLDYEVRESVADILPMLDGAPVPSPVPVPTTDALTMPEEAAGSGDGEQAGRESADVQFVDVKGAGEKTEAETAAAVAAVAAHNAAVEAAEGKPKRTRRKKDKPAPAGTPATEGERKLPARRRTARKTPLELSSDQIERLVAMSPRSVKKLQNTLKSQFRVDDPERTVKALIEHEVVSADEQEHLTWRGNPA